MECLQQVQGSRPEAGPPSISAFPDIISCSPEFLDAAEALLVFFVPPIEDEQRRERGGDAAFRPVEILYFRHSIDYVLSDALNDIVIIRRARGTGL